MASMPRTMRQDSPGSHRVELSRSASGPEQQGFSFAEKAQVDATKRELLAMFVEAVKLVKERGGVSWLTSKLDCAPSYESKINGAINGEQDRKVQLDWFAPLLDDPNAADFIAAWICQRTKHEPPVKKRVIEDSAIETAAREVIAEMKDHDQRDLMRARIAKKVGCRPEDVKL